MKIEIKKEDLKSLLDQIESFLYVVLQLLPENRVQLATTRQKIAFFNEEEIEERIQLALKNIDKLSKEYGLKVSMSKIVELCVNLRKKSNSSHESCAYLGKGYLKDYFKYPEKILGENWRSTPNHFLIGYIPYQTEDKRFVWYLPEAHEFSRLICPLR